MEKNAEDPFYSPNKDSAKRSGGFRYLATGILLVVIILAAGVYLYTRGAVVIGNNTRTTTVMTTALNTLFSSPKVANFSITATHYLTQTQVQAGASHGYFFNYNGGSGYKLAMRILMFPNSSSALILYNSISASLHNSTVPFSGLPANETGGLARSNSTVNPSLYSITAHFDNELITSTLSVPYGAGIAASTAVQILTGAVNSAALNYTPPFG